MAKKKQEPTTEHRLANAETNIRLYTDLYQLVKKQLKAVLAEIKEMKARIEVLEEHNRKSGR
jgi:hypothetical protein